MECPQLTPPCPQEMESRGLEQLQGEDRGWHWGAEQEAVGQRQGLAPLSEMPGPLSAVLTQWANENNTTPYSTSSVGAAASRPQRGTRHWPGTRSGCRVIRYPGHTERRRAGTAHAATLLTPRLGTGSPGGWPERIKSTGPQVGVHLLAAHTVSHPTPASAEWLPPCGPPQPSPLPPVNSHSLAQPRRLPGPPGSVSQFPGVPLLSTCPD